MPTFGGWNIITMPTDPPAPKSVEWALLDTVAANRSPFALKQQTYDWQASLLRASLSYAPMPGTKAFAWKAFLMAARGISNIFLFGDPDNLGPQNPSATPGTVTGSNQSGYQLVTSSSGLLSGDWIQVGQRLYMVTSASGGTLGIWPQIRESPAGGTALVITNTQGLFRLTKNERRFTSTPGKIYGFTFEIEEAI